MRRHTEGNRIIYSAGVLPFAIRGETIYFLLGKDFEGNWSDFGGRSEPRDRGEPTKTASREFYEESIGAVMEMIAMEHKLRSKKTTKINARTLSNYDYYMYLVPIPYINYTDRFRSTYNFLRNIECDRKYREKQEVRWFSLETIIAAISRHNINNRTAIPLRRIFYNTLVQHRDVFENKEFLP